MFKDFPCTRKPFKVESLGERWPTVYVREITVADLDECSRIGADGTADSLTKAAALFICDEAGKRLYAPGDAVQLASLGIDGLQKIVRAGMEFNGLGAQPGNSPAGPNG